ncbi:hypothetical protein MAR_019067, partial [Mya arenaria]
MPQRLLLMRGGHIFPRGCLKTQVNVEAGLSPGEHTVQYAKKCALKRKQCQQRSQLPSTKRRRLFLKQDRCVTQAAHEALEGASYQSVRGGQMPHITQLDAVELSSGKTFNCYIRPEIPISDNAQQVTGITMVGDREMMVDGRLVTPSSWKSASIDFLNWLKKHENAFLVAHNGRRFDFPVIMSAYTNVHQCDFLLEHTHGMIDSLPLFRKVFPKRSSYKQEDIVHDLLGIEYKAHNAEEDVKSLASFVSNVVNDHGEKSVLENSFPAKAAYFSVLSCKERVKNMPSLYRLVASGVMKSATAENIAGSGLNVPHSKKIYDRS